MHASSVNTPATDDIDLRQLAYTLWASKRLIACTTVVLTALAAGYAFLTPATYQTEVITLPPPPSDLASYNMGHQLSGPAIDALTKNNKEERHTTADNAIPALTPDDAYDSFLRIANSMTLRQQFFDEIYLPYALTQGMPNDAQTKAGLWKRFITQLKITLPKKTDAPLMTLSLKGKEPEIIAEWANRYVDMAAVATKKQLQENLRGAMHVQLSSIEQQIKAMRQSGEADRQNTIAKLKEALALAKAIGMEAPPSSGNLITSYSGDTMYLRGTKALEAELALIQSRDSNDPYTLGLPNLLKQQTLLKSVNVAPDDLEVVRIDQMATPPEAPIKPKKALIIALGLVLGGMLGAFWALMRHALRKT